MMLTTVRRDARSVLVVLLVTFLVVALLSIAPGSVATVILGENATPEAVAELNARLGLDQPLFGRYIEWFGGALQGDLGTSLLTGEPVTEAIVDRLPVTLELAVLTQVIALAVAVPLAVFAASRPGGLLDRAASTLSSTFLSVPAFVAGPVLVYLFALSVPLFPVTGWSDLDEGLGANLQSALFAATSAPQRTILLVGSALG